MATMITDTTAVTSSPRLRLTQTRADHAVLDGAWWPRSWDATAELANLAPALSERYGRIRYVMLNGSEWIHQVRRLAVDGNVIRVGWFDSMSDALLVVTTDRGDQVDLVIIAPSFAEDAAGRVMAKAADPANVAHAPDLLAASVGRVAPAATAAAEAVRNNEGGAQGG